MNSRTQSEQIVREAVIKAVPEILVYRTEAYVLWDKLSELADKNLWNRLNKKEWNFANKYLFERPIRLSDLLQTFRSTQIGVKVYRDGAMDFFPFKGHTVWNLRADSLSEQSDETCAFLAELFSKGE